MPVSPVTPAASRSTSSHAPCPVLAIGLSALSSQLSTRQRAWRHCRAPSSRRRLGGGGFTLLELLTVMGIIAILAGIVLGVGRRANESGKIARAKVELAALANALEAYKTQYGDYPQTANAARLLQSLIGKTGPTGVTIANGRALIESAKFAIALPTTPTVPADPFANNTSVLIDPWDHPYVYAYKFAGAASWKNSSFVLMCMGPDNDSTGIHDDGIISTAYEAETKLGKLVNADNLYANRN